MTTTPTGQPIAKPKPAYTPRTNTIVRIGLEQPDHHRTPGDPHNWNDIGEAIAKRGAFDVLGEWYPRITEALGDPPDLLIQGLTGAPHSSDVTVFGGGRDAATAMGFPLPTALSDEAWAAWAKFNNWMADNHDRIAIPWVGAAPFLLFDPGGDNKPPYFRINAPKHPHWAVRQMWDDALRDVLSQGNFRGVGFDAMNWANDTPEWQVQVLDRFSGRFVIAETTTTHEVYKHAQPLMASTRRGGMQMKATRFYIESDEHRGLINKHNPYDAPYYIEANAWKPEEIQQGIDTIRAAGGVPVVSEFNFRPDNGGTVERPGRV